MIEVLANDASSLPLDQISTLPQLIFGQERAYRSTYFIVYSLDRHGIHAQLNLLALG
jgi:hypothetical protein